MTTTTVQALGTTAHLTPMTPEALVDWAFVTDKLRGVGAVHGYLVTHPAAGDLGLIFAKGRDCHAEWLIADAGEYLYAGKGRTLQYALAHILRAHESTGHSVPQDSETAAEEEREEAVHDTRAAEAKRAIHAASERGATWVFYTGSIAELREVLLLAAPCGDHCPCQGFELYLPNGREIANHAAAQNLHVTTARPGFLWGTA